MQSLSAKRLSVYAAHDRATLPAWRRAFREGLAPELSTAALEALVEGLALGDPAIIQRATTDPPPLPVCCDWPVEAADPLAYALWRSEGLVTVEQVEARWAQLVQAADLRLGWPGATRPWFAWCDSVARKDLRARLFVELRRELRRRDAWDARSVARRAQ